VLVKALLQKAIATVFDAVGVTPLIVCGLDAAVVPVTSVLFTLHENPLPVGLNTYITEVKPLVPAPTLMDGLADHVPLKVHQKIAVDWFKGIICIDCIPSLTSCLINGKCRTGSPILSIDNNEVARLHQRRRSNRRRSRARPAQRYH
jgi:hypothetical protein